MDGRTDVTGVAANAAVYAEREQRIAAAVALEKPDRVPIVYQGEAFSAVYSGVGTARYCNDDAAPVEAHVKTLEGLGGYDALNSVVGGRIGPLLSSAWLTRVRVPGRELPDGVVWQVDEAAPVMAVEGYDRILAEGWGPVYESLLAEVVDMEELGGTLAWLEENTAATIQTFRDLGYPIMSSGGIVTPFESLCGARTMAQFYMDLYRRPDVVKAAMDAILPDTIAFGVGAAQASGVQCTWIGGWRSSSGMLSETQWLEFVLPHVKLIAEALVEGSITPILHFDHDWTRALPHLRELPAQKCILMTDGMTDIRAAKEILGGHMAVMGDVPPTLLATGTPEDVRTYVRDLVRDVGPDGFLLSPGCDAPVNAKPENMQALCDAGHEFG